MGNIAVIIPAAGKSERFGGSEKKTFAKIDGRPMFLRTLELFLRREDVCQTILAVAPEDIDTMKTVHGAALGFLGVRIVSGGARRCDTVAAALQTLSDDAQYVAIHDAARPCVAVERIDAVFAEAAKTGAAILAAPLTGTIKRVSATMTIDETVSREGLYEAQTPQVFRRDILTQAYAQTIPATDDVTDDAQLVERTGHPVAIVASDASNLKITSRGDLTLAAAIIKTRPSRQAPRMGAFEEAQW